MSDSWVPPKGKRAVAAGPSLTRALHARQGGAGRSRHIRDFYSFRYNFKPPSVDADERGKVIVQASNVTVERPSTQSSESHRWIGKEAPAKEWDCVLIYDEASDQSFTLEKLESVLTLKHQPRTSASEALAPAASPTKHAVTHSSRQDTNSVHPDEDADADADGDDYFEEILPDSLKEEEEEGEEGEVIPLPLPPPPPPVATKPARVKATPVQAPVAKAPIKPIPAPAPTPVPTKVPAKPPPPAPIPIKATPAPPPVSPPIPKTRPKPVPLPRGKKHKREEPPVPAPTSHHLSDADEEDLQFGRPAKRARPSPPPSRGGGGLALPSASTAAFIPPAPAPAPPVQPIEVGSESEEDEEWDEVAAVGKTVEIEDDFDIFGDAVEAGDEDNGMDELERELNMHMDEDEEDEDFLAAVVEEAPPSRGAPMSLKELAASATYGSDEEYSSSDESDED
ncbi:hypothetical protein C0991_002995 [Blastosporella zonata]|nr:hypothetical protein C0991_002995 [Blastosporella zonata]